MTNKKVEQPTVSESYEQIVELSNRCTRSIVAVIDTIASRGGFRGEELATIGQLRDQGISLIQLIEEEQGLSAQDASE